MPTADPLDDSVRSTACVLHKFLEHLAEAHHHRMADRLAASDLTLTQFRALIVLHQRCDAIPVNTLAEGVELSLAAAGRAVDRLVGLGLVDRREDCADRRVKRVSLTAEGRELIDEQFMVQLDDLTGMVTSLPADVRDSFRACLTDVLTTISPEKVTS